MCFILVSLHSSSSFCTALHFHAVRRRVKLCDFGFSRWKEGTYSSTRCSEWQISIWQASTPCGCSGAVDVRFLAGACVPPTCLKLPQSCNQARSRVWTHYSRRASVHLRGWHPRCCAGSATHSPRTCTPSASCCGENCARWLPLYKDIESLLEDVLWNYELVNP